LYNIVTMVGGVFAVAKAKTPPTITRLYIFIPKLVIVTSVRLLEIVTISCGYDSKTTSSLL